MGAGEGRGARLPYSMRERCEKRKRRAKKIAKAFQQQGDENRKSLDVFFFFFLKRDGLQMWVLTDFEVAERVDSPNPSSSCIWRISSRRRPLMQSVRFTSTCSHHLCPFLHSAQNIRCFSFFLGALANVCVCVFCHSWHHKQDAPCDSIIHCFFCVIMHAIVHFYKRMQSARKLWSMDLVRMQ